MPPQPTTVIFDLGKVLLDFDFSIAARALSPQCGIVEDKVRILIDQSPLLHRFEHGEMTSEEFYEAFRKQSKFRGTFDEFTNAFADIFTPIQPLIDLAMSLRARNVPLYIFSNTNVIAITHVGRKYPFFVNFDGYILSYQHGAMKPEPRLYEVVEEFTGCRGPALLYLDDRLENIQTAQPRGWRTIHVQTVPQTLADFASALNPQ